MLDPSAAPAPAARTDNPADDPGCPASDRSSCPAPGHRHAPGRRRGSGPTILKTYGSSRSRNITSKLFAAFARPMRHASVLQVAAGCHPVLLPRQSSNAIHHSADRYSHRKDQAESHADSAGGRPPNLRPPHHHRTPPAPATRKAAQPLGAVNQHLDTQSLICCKGVRWFLTRVPKVVSGHKAQASPGRSVTRVTSRELDGADFQRGHTEHGERHAEARTSIRKSSEHRSGRWCSGRPPSRNESAITIRAIRS